MATEKNKLKEIRKQNELTTTKLAELVGVTVVTLSRWENGHVPIPLTKAEKLSDVLGVTVAELLGFNESDSSKMEFGDNDNYLGLMWSVNRMFRNLSDEDAADIANSLKKIVRALTDSNKRSGQTGLKQLSFVRDHLDLIEKYLDEIK